MNRFAPPLLATVCAVFSSVSVLAAPAQTGASPIDKSIPNFATVTPGILRGAAPTDQGLVHLKQRGVRTIIDLRIEKKGQAEEAQAAQKLGISRVRIPMGREAPTTKQVQTFLQIINDPAKQPVFVHCQHGADRTGAMIGIYRVTHDKWDFARAYAEMRRYGFKPFLHELKGAVEKRATTRH